MARKFGNINNDEVIFASVGKKDDGYGKIGYGIAYFFQNEDNGELLFLVY